MRTFTVLMPDWQLGDAGVVLHVGDCFSIPALHFDGVTYPVADGPESFEPGVAGDAAFVARVLASDSVRRNDSFAGQIALEALGIRFFAEGAANMPHVRGHGLLRTDVHFWEGERTVMETTLVVRAIHAAARYVSSQSESSDSPGVELNPVGSAEDGGRWREFSLRVERAAARPDLKAIGRLH